MRLLKTDDELVQFKVKEGEIVGAVVGDIDMDMTEIYESIHLHHLYHTYAKLLKDIKGPDD